MGHAELSIYYEWFPDANQLDITIYQNQDTTISPIYVLPMDVDFYYEGKVERKRITLDRAIQTFSFNFPVKPDLVNVDAEKMLLGNKYDNKDIDSYIFQYQHAPLYRDRAESLEALAPYQAEDSRYRDLITSALDDKHWSLRQFAVDTLLIDDSTPQSVKDKIISMAQSDPRSYVRAAALNKLKDITGIDAWSVYNAAMNDSSYAVMANAMMLIYNNDKKKGLELARVYRTEQNDNLAYSIMSILGDGGEAIDNDYFIAKFQESSGFESYYVMMNYEPFILRMTDSYVIKKGVDELKKIANDGNNFWMSFTAINILNSMATTYQETMDAATDLLTKQSMQSALDYVNAALVEVNGGGEY
jgi:aminopeptidase N